MANTYDVIVIGAGAADLSAAPQSRPEGGYTSLLTALAAALPQNKVRIRLQSTAVPSAPDGAR